ncbi:amidohydrolase family protein [Catenulispora yoronensis]
MQHGVDEAVLPEERGRRRGAVAAVPGVAFAAPRSTPPQARVTLTNVRVFDGRTVGAPTSVTIENGVIGFSPLGTRTIDAKGAVLLPGLIDAHVHLTDVTTLQQLTAHGVTTAMDMAGWPASHVDSLRHQAGLTDIRSAGVPAAEPGSIQSHLPGFPASALLTSPQQALPFVAARVTEGSDYVKVIVDVPGLSPDIIEALARAAHAYGRALMAHAVSAQAIDIALDAGADMVHHTPLDVALDPGTVAQYKAGGRVSVPTLTMMQGFAQLGIPGLDYAAASGSVVALHQAGVTILAGTDANLTPGIPVQPAYGASLHQELKLLVQAGLSNVEALRAATVVPAAAFGLYDRGVIRPGARADLVLIGGDPTTDITATGDIQRVWAAGVEYPLTA